MKYPSSSFWEIELDNEVFVTVLLVCKFKAAYLGVCMHPKGTCVDKQTRKKSGHFSLFRPLRLGTLACQVRAEEIANRVTARDLVV